VNHHLRLLRAANVVRVEKEGKAVLYSAADDHIRAVLKAMAAHVGEAPQAGDAEDSEPLPDAARG
jgi:DNA-binding transcriptional ArsR family regulator